jgi:NAD-dependent deacetylase
LESPKYVVDPKLPDVGSIPYLKMFAEKASVGMELLKKELLEVV